MAPLSFQVPPLELNLVPKLRLLKPTLSREEFVDVFPPLFSRAENKREMIRTSDGLRRQGTEGG
jgi:hypothetical protein